VNSTHRTIATVLPPLTLEVCLIAKGTESGCEGRDHAALPDPKGVLLSPGGARRTKRAVRWKHAWAATFESAEVTAFLPRLGTIVPATQHAQSAAGHRNAEPFATSLLCSPKSANPPGHNPRRIR
jgi:hypothetical protein